MAELRTTFDSGSDGVLTNEVGVISGELDLRTTCSEDGIVALDVTYAGADE